MTDVLVEKARRRLQLPEPGQCRWIREQAQVSQRELADQVGVTRPTVTRWEAGLRRPRGIQLDRYAELIDQLRQALLG